MTDTTAEASTSTTNAGDQTTTDTATVDTTTATPAATAPETKAPEPVIPEKYDLQMPEGVTLDSTAADEFTAIAKELKLDQGQAQKLASVAAAMQQRQAAQHAKTVESWVESVKTDKEIGGDNLAENLGIARKALDTFGSPELRDVLNATGFGNHPAVIKAFYKMGKAVSEDRFVTGGVKAANTDMAKTMFPSMN